MVLVDWTVLNEPIHLHMDQNLIRCMNFPFAEVQMVEWL